MLKSAFDKISAQKDPRMGLVREGNVFFLVLNTKQNEFDVKHCKKLEGLLD